MPLILKLARTVIYPALWLGQEEFEELRQQGKRPAELMTKLAAVEDEVLRDIGGLPALIESVEWDRSAPCSINLAAHRRYTQRMSEIRDALVRHRGNYAAAALDLQVHPSTLMRWMKEGQGRRRGPNGKPSDAEIQAALARNNGNKVSAARDLGVNASTLWRWMKRSAEDAHERLQA